MSLVRQRVWARVFHLVAINLSSEPGRTMFEHLRAPAREVALIGAGDAQIKKAPGERRPVVLVGAADEIAPFDNAAFEKKPCELIGRTVRGGRHVHCTRWQATGG
jgi:hypothetical protein